MWALTGAELYLTLTEDAGWTPAQYETWIAEMLERVLPRS